MRWVLMLPVLLYRWLISQWKPRCCRFDPTCSHYALLALRRHGALRGSWLSVRRVLRCHPFTEPDYDPVPERGTGSRRERRQRRTCQT
jgi:putative membrane protein insertion efficiency factor